MNFGITTICSILMTLAIVLTTQSVAQEPKVDFLQKLSQLRAQGAKYTKANCEPFEKAISAIPEGNDKVSVFYQSKSEAEKALKLFKTAPNTSESDREAAWLIIKQPVESFKLKGFLDLYGSPQLSCAQMAKFGALQRLEDSYRHFKLDNAFKKSVQSSLYQFVRTETNYPSSLVVLFLALGSIGNAETKGFVTFSSSEKNSFDQIYLEAQTFREDLQKRYKEGGIQGDKRDPELLYFELQSANKIREKLKKFLTASSEGKNFFPSPHSARQSHDLK